MKTAVGIFRPDEAPRVIDDLFANGISEEALNVIVPGQRLSPGTEGLPLDRMRSHVPGLHALDVDGIGPVMASGPLLAAAEHDGHTAIDELESLLVGEGMSKDKAAAFFSSVRRGDTLIAARADESELDDVIAIMKRHFDQQRTGTTREKVNTRAAGASGPASETPTGGEVRLPVGQEELHVGKREVERGGVRMRSIVSEKPVEETVQLTDERVDVERRATDTSSTSPDLFQEKEIEIRARGEEPVIAKETHITEEVVARKQAEQKSETVRDTVRRQDVEVEPIEQYRPHYEQRFAEREKFEDVEPAYRYGEGLRRDEAHAGKSFSEVEAKARSDWEQHKPSTWERFRDAVKHAFEWNGR